MRAIVRQRRKDYEAKLATLALLLLLLARDAHGDDSSMEGEHGAAVMMGCSLGIT